MLSVDGVRFVLNRIRERLWVRPLLVCLLAFAATVGAKLMDRTQLGPVAPEVSPQTLETLLSVMASSMLVVATFAVASMLSAYASVSNSATPRSFRLVVADDVSQNALSTFVGAFIFSIVAWSAIQNDSFGSAGRFSLFVLTVLIWGFVLFIFVRWVDRIARLGRLGTTIGKVERATAKALRRRREHPRLGGAAVTDRGSHGAIFSEAVGYVQGVDVARLQRYAEEWGVRLRLAALPGTLVAPGRPLVEILDGKGESQPVDHAQVAEAFVVGNDRLFDDDPRFGLVVLAEIAGRALSPAVNDSGTAIGIIGSFVRLFVQWSGWTPRDGEDDAAPSPEVKYDRVEVPELSAMDLFDDAFTSIARDGAGMVEVGVRLQKGLLVLRQVGDPALEKAARHHAALARARAEAVLTLEADLEAIRAVAPDPGALAKAL
jgi:uncharacterized membrane protein